MWLVMPALVAGIHVLKAFDIKDVDGRDKPGHDDAGAIARTAFWPGVAGIASETRYEARPMTVILRPLAPGDLDDIAALWLASWQLTMPEIDFAARLPWFRNHLAELMAKGYRVTCAVRGDRVVGFTAVEESEGHLDQIAVHPDSWGGDVADRLIASAKARAGRIILDVNQENPRAIRFYEKHGFRRLKAGANPASGRLTWWYEWP
jgi:putative acetyltransferase